MSQYQAWWKQKKLLPSGQLPEKIQTLLVNEDPALIDEVCAYAYHRYQEALYQDETEATYDWLWNLSLHPSPIVKQALVKLFSRYEFWDYCRFVRKAISYTSGYYLYPSYSKNARYHLIPFEGKTSQGSGTLHIIKALYKRAEEEQDEALWSILAYRFDIGKYHYYSKKTRHYMRRRAWRYLRRLGKKGSSAYVRMATNVLLNYEIVDGRLKRLGPNQRVRSYTHLWLFNHLLYHNSSRFFYSSSRYWQDRGMDSYPEQLPDEREEAFPELWDQHPEKLFFLLMNAKAEPVLQFASRALRLGNPHYLSQTKLKELLQAEHTIQRAFAARLLLERMNADQPDFELLLTLLFSTFAETRKEAERYLVKQKHRWGLERIHWLINQMYERLVDNESTPFFLIDTLMELLSGPLKEEVAQLATIEMAKQFSNASYEALQAFAGPLLLMVEVDAFTKEDLLPFLVHAQAEVREAAQQRLENEWDRLQLDGEWFTDYVRKADEESHVFLYHFYKRHRNQLLFVLPELIEGLWLELLRTDGSESVQDWIVEKWFSELLFEELLETPLEKILQLLEHPNAKVQAFAAQLLEHQPKEPRQFTFQLLLSMAHHRIAAVRALARKMIMEAEDRITNDWIINLMETDWEDTREWMFDYVRSFPPSKITPDLIYGLLDTSRLEIQQLVKELVHQHADSLDFKELMLRGSEHPDLAAQEMVLEWAEVVTWDPETVEKMELFFRTVLLRVHRGRKAKQKALSLLLRLGEQNLAFAEIVVSILADVVRNQGVKDFETILAALTRIQLRFPTCSTPIEIA